VPEGQRAAQLLKLRPYRTAVIHNLQLREPQSVTEGEIGPQSAFCTDEVLFHWQEYINTQNTYYGSSQSSHLTHEVLLNPVTFGVWCAVSARRLVRPMFF
jgi:hypothetical protein